MEQWLLGCSYIPHRSRGGGDGMQHMCREHSGVHSTHHTLARGQQTDQQLPRVQPRLLSFSFHSKEVHSDPDHNDHTHVSMCREHMSRSEVRSDHIHIHVHTDHCSITRGQLQDQHQHQLLAQLQHLFSQQKLQEHHLPQLQQEQLQGPVQSSVPHYKVQRLPHCSDTRQLAQCR